MSFSLGAQGRRRGKSTSRKVAQSRRPRDASRQEEGRDRETDNVERGGGRGAYRRAN